MPSNSSNGSPNPISKQIREATASLASLIGYRIIEGKYVEEIILEFEAMERQFTREAINSGNTTITPHIWAVQNALKMLRQNSR